MGATWCLLVTFRQYFRSRPALLNHENGYASNGCYYERIKDKNDNIKFVLSGTLNFENRSDF